MLLCYDLWALNVVFSTLDVLFQHAAVDVAGYGRQSWLHETFRALQDIWAVFLNIYSLPVIIRTVELRG